MPAKDRYHDNKVHALEKDGWSIEADPTSLIVQGRHLFVNLLARHNENRAVFVEVKVFESVDSPMNYLANTVGQYLLYQTALDDLGDTTPLYLTVPTRTYQTFFAEVLPAHYIQFTGVKLVIFDPVDEEITQWIT